MDCARSRIARITCRGYAVAPWGWISESMPTWNRHLPEHSGPGTPLVQVTSVTWLLPHERVPTSPKIGVCRGVAVYLLYNGILGDKSVNGGNVLTRAILARLPPHDGPRTIYGAGCGTDRGNGNVADVVGRIGRVDLSVSYAATCSRSTVVPPRASCGEGKGSLGPPLVYPADHCRWLDPERPGPHDRQSRP